MAKVINFLLVALLIPALGESCLIIPSILAAAGAAKTAIMAHLAKENVKFDIKNTVLDRRIDAIELEPFIEERRYELELRNNLSLEVNYTTNPLEVGFDFSLNLTGEVNSSTNPLEVGYDVSLNLTGVVDSTLKPLEVSYDFSLDDRAYVENATEVVAITAEPLDYLYAAENSSSDVDNTKINLMPPKGA